MLPTEFIRECLHRYVNVTFKNGELYTGILDKCDNLANFVLTSVTVHSPTKPERTLEKAMIRGSSVQCLVLSQEINEIVRTKRAIVQRQGAPNQNRNNYENNRQEKQQRNQNYNNYNNYEDRRNSNNNRGRGGNRGGYRGRGGYNNANRERQMVYNPP